MPRNNEEATMAGPVRMCVICRRRYPKKALQRHVVAGGGLEGDSTQTRPGRGYYVCSDEACLSKFAKFRPQTRRVRGKKAATKRDT